MGGHDQPPRSRRRSSRRLQRDLAAAVALASRVAIAYPNDGLILHYQGYALYRAGVCSCSRRQDATPIFERARDILEKSLKSRILPETHMLMSSIDGQLIGRNPSRAMELGMASQGVDQRGAPRAARRTRASG